MRMTLALSVVGAVILSSVSAIAQQTMAQQTMAQQTPQAPRQTPSSQIPGQGSTQGSSQGPNQAPANQIDSTRTQPPDKSLTEFWTPERLREARPMPTPSVDEVKE